MTVYEALTLVGIPSITVAIFRLIYRRATELRAAQRALESGIQALLRAQMISDFNKYSELGYAPIYARENFENCWRQYHALGANGVIDDLHAKFLALPTDESKEKQIKKEDVK